MDTLVYIDPRFRQFCTAIATIVWTGERPMTTQQLQHQLDAEAAHNDAAQEQAESEADAESERSQAEAAQAREARRSEDATRRRQQSIRNGQVMFAQYAKIAA